MIQTFSLGNSSRYGALAPIGDRMVKLIELLYEDFMGREAQLFFYEEGFTSKSLKMACELHSLFKQSLLENSSLKKILRLLPILSLIILTGCSRALLDIDILKKNNILDDRNNNSSNILVGKSLTWGTGVPYSLRNGNELYVLNKNTSEFEKIKDFDISLNLEVVHWNEAPGETEEGFPFYLIDNNTRDLYKLDEDLTLTLFGNAGMFSNRMKSGDVHLEFSSQRYMDKFSTSLEYISSAYGLDPALYGTGVNIYHMLGHSFFAGTHYGNATNDWILFNGNNRTFQEIPHSDESIINVGGDNETFTILSTESGSHSWILKFSDGSLTELASSMEVPISFFIKNGHSYIIKQSALDATIFKMYEMNAINNNLTYLNSFSGSIKQDHGQSCFSSSENILYDSIKNELLFLCSPNMNIGEGDKGEVFSYNVADKSIQHFTLAPSTYWETSSAGSYSPDGFFYANGSLYVASNWMDSQSTAMKMKKMNLSNSEITFEEPVQIFEIMQKAACTSLSLPESCNASVLTAQQMGVLDGSVIMIMTMINVEGEMYITPISMIKNNELAMSSPVIATDSSTLMEQFTDDMMKLMSSLKSGKFLENN